MAYNTVHLYILPYVIALLLMQNVDPFSAYISYSHFDACICIYYTYVTILHLAVFYFHYTLHKTKIPSYVILDYLEFKDKFKLV